MALRVMSNAYARDGRHSISQKLIRIHIHRHEDILGEGEFFEHRRRWRVRRRMARVRSMRWKR